MISDTLQCDLQVEQELFRLYTRERERRIQLQKKLDALHKKVKQHRASSKARKIAYALVKAGRLAR